MRKVKNFFKTPKGLLTIILALLTTIAAPHEGVVSALAGMGSAAAIAGAVDLLVLRLREKPLEFPQRRAVLTAMIVAMVLRSQEHWYVVAITSVIAVVRKYAIRSRTANVFNPAALGIVATVYIFHTGQSWWGALPEASHRLRSL